MKICEFERKIDAIFDRIIDNDEVIALTRDDGKSVMLLSKQHWCGLCETLYLYSYGEKYVASIIEAAKTPIEEFIDATDVDL